MADIAVVGSEERLAEDPPVVHVVNLILLGAIRKGATEIRIEPDQEGPMVDYLIEGCVFGEMAPPKKMHEAIVARLKVMSHLNLANHDVRQEGQFRQMVGAGREQDFRVVVEPTSFGEKVTLLLI